MGSWESQHLGILSNQQGQSCVSGPSSLTLFVSHPGRVTASPGALCACLHARTCVPARRRGVGSRRAVGGRGPEAAGWSLSLGQNLLVLEWDHDALPNSQALAVSNEVLADYPDDVPGDGAQGGPSAANSGPSSHCPVDVRTAYGSPTMPPP